MKRGQPAHTDLREQQLKKALKEQESLIDYAIKDSTAYTFISSTGRSDYGDSFAVFQEENTGVWKCIYENDFTELKPWKLELADVDGDGMTDILTGVRKTTYYDNTEKNRLFIFDYIDHKLVKKWTGSQIAGIWTDFAAGDLLEAKGDEIIFISQTEKGLERLKLFSWFDFGFLMLAESEEYEDITDLTMNEERHIQMTCHSEGEKKIILMVKDGRIVQSK